MSKHNKIGEITVDGLNKAVYWIGQTQLYHAILEQIFRPSCQGNIEKAELTPTMAWPSLFTGAEFFLRMYLFGLSVLDTDVYSQSWACDKRTRRLKKNLLQLTSLLHVLYEVLADELSGCNIYGSWEALSDKCAMTPILMNRDQ